MANDRVEVTLSVPGDVSLDELLITEDTGIIEINEHRESEERSLAERLTGERDNSAERNDSHTSVKSTALEEGEYYLDPKGPTPSPEKNTVRVINIPGDRIDEHTIGSSDETVHEYNGKQYDPSDPVVEAVYPHLNTEKAYSFPASRLREV